MAEKTAQQQPQQHSGGEEGGGSSRAVCIGSRDSQLALVQTNHVKDKLQAAHPGLALRVETMKTLGDKILDVALAKIGDKGLFTKELEVGMLERHIDMAVHSLKDLPTHLPEGLVIGAVLEREVPNDAVVMNPKHTNTTLAALPPGAVVGTSSLRRRSQLSRAYPHLTFRDVRGNLSTRLRKLDSGEYDALILAYAGLTRLGLDNRIAQVLSFEQSLHAVGQGALAVECREGDEDILSLLSGLHHEETALCCYAERSFLRELEGGCQVPVGVTSKINTEKGTILLKGAVLTIEGDQCVEGSFEGPLSDPEVVGITLARDLKKRGADKILQDIFSLSRQ